MPHLGIEHEEERTVLSPTNNILSQSLSDIKVGGSGGRFTGGGTAGSFGRSPSEIGRRGGLTGTRGAGLAGEVATEFRKPTVPRGMLARIGELPERPIVTPESRAELVTEAEVFTPSMSTQPSVSRGITPEVVTPVTAPVLGDIDTTTFEGLVKGVGTVAGFVKNLQKFNRARGITPGGKGRRKIKTGDIQNRIKFLQTQLNEGIVEEEQEDEITDELDILNQFIQSRLGVGATRASRAREETQRQEDIQAILAR